MPPSKVKKARRKYSAIQTKRISRHSSASDAVDAQLDRYRSMRDFAITAEPSGLHPSTKKPHGRLPFVIQKHAATRMHYDFRLGWRGVLKSWAVTKGPSYFPGDKRLAVQVEDHPMEYGGFEGTIPKGQYGGGTVMLWDHGTWEPLEDADEGLARGNLKFTLRGKKLQGNWVLVRMAPHEERDRGKSNWLLIKEHDTYEQNQTDEPITERSPNSVLTGRSLEQIAHDDYHSWNSNRPEKQAKASRNSERHIPVEPVTAKNKTSAMPRRIRLPIEAKKETLPRFIAPQLATQSRVPPESGIWLHELKLDGYRMQARISSSAGKGQHSREVKLLTRTGLDWTHRMKDLAGELTLLPVESAVLDGEVVVVDDSGLTSFAELQAAFQNGEQKRIAYFVFDLLHLNGYNLRPLKLRIRKELLREILVSYTHGHAGESMIRFSEHLETAGARMFAEACRMGAEGIVSKLEDKEYVSGRSAFWIKIKCQRQQELVIGGFTLPSNGTAGIGALLLGYYYKGKLIYAGRSGTGFTQKTSASLRARLENLRSANSSFSGMLASASRGVHWVKPGLVAEISFATWTADNLVRQAAFKGLREDKPAKEVVREEPAAAPTEMASKKTASRHAVSAKIKQHQHKQAKKLPSTKKNLHASSPSSIPLTHPEKVLDIASHLTKLQLAEYYASVAIAMLPHIADRPLSIVRCPRGSSKPCFYQKHVGTGLPAGIGGIQIPSRKGGPSETYLTLSTPQALVGLAQLGVLEVHPWGSKNNSLEKPDRFIVDLDPDTSIPWHTLVASALDVRARLKRLGLKSFVKSTGGKGLHIVVPIVPEHEWPVIKDFVHRLALAMEADNRQLYLTKMNKAARKGKIYIDYLRNERGATAVAPYSPRARAGTPVAVPLTWKELQLPQRPEFTVANFFAWKKRLQRDPWKNMMAVQQRLPMGK